MFVRINGELKYLWRAVDQDGNVLDILVQNRRFAEPTAEDLPPGSGGVHYKDGRVYGWVAQVGEPHVGYPGKKLTIESLGALDLTHFLRARFAFDDGTFIKAGAMTMNVGHHRDGAECEIASCQFDDTRTARSSPSA